MSASSQTLHQDLQAVTSRTQKAAVELQRVMSELQKLDTRVALEGARARQLSAENTQLRTLIAQPQAITHEAHIRRLEQQLSEALGALEVAQRRVELLQEANAELEATLDDVEDRVETQQKELQQRDEKIERLRASLLSRQETHSKPRRPITATGLTRPQNVARGSSLPSPRRSSSTWKIPHKDQLG